MKINIINGPTYSLEPSGKTRRFNEDLVRSACEIREVANAQYFSSKYAGNDNFQAYGDARVASDVKWAHDFFHIGEIVEVEINRTSDGGDATVTLKSVTGESVMLWTTRPIESRTLPVRAMSPHLNSSIKTKVSDGDPRYKYSGDDDAGKRSDRRPWWTFWK